jgi:hypothetical protein
MSQLEIVDQVGDQAFNFIIWDGIPDQYHLTTFDNMHIT